MIGYWKTSHNPYGVQYRTVHYGGRKYISAKHPKGLRMTLVMDANAHPPIHQWAIIL
jgi:hypothetical protein